MKRGFVWCLVLAAVLWPLVVKQQTGKWPAPKGSLDFAGGVRLTYEMDPSDETARGITNDSLRAQALQRAKDTFLFRLRDFDLSELSVRTEGDRDLVVEAPGIAEIQNVLDRIGGAQVITFRILNEDETYAPSPFRPCFRFPADQTCSAVGPPVMDHSDFNYWDIRSEPDSSAPGKYAVLLAVRDQKKFESVTRKYYRKRLAICLDQEIRFAPLIDDSGIVGDAVITGYPTVSESEEVVRLLKAGPLPVSFNLVEQKVVSPTLGRRSFDSALVVLGFGVAAICLLLFLAYSNQVEFVMMVVICQAVQAGLIYFLSWRGYLTLNMLSVCALGILSGVSVDNLILIFEEFNRRWREEQGQRIGIGAVIMGLDGALARETPIILRANILSLATVLPLYFLGGAVQSLVTTMVAGTALAVVATLILARWMLKMDWVIEGLKRLSRALGPVLQLRFNLFGLNKVFLCAYLSALAATGFLISTRGLVKSIDFTSGAEISVFSDVGIDTEKLESVANEYFGRRCSVRHLSAATLQPGVAQGYTIQIPGLESTVSSAPGRRDNDAPTPPGFVKRLQDVLSHPVQLASVSAVGATVTGITMRATFWSAAAGLAVLSFFLLRKYGAGIAASIVIALACDATITLGAIGYFEIPMSLPILSALLTVVGYSVYDSIVVAGHLCDDARRQGFYTEPAFNRSLSNLSRRMVLTVATTTMAALSIAVYCGGLLRDFGIVMTAGSVFGMMSTASIVARALKSSLVRPARPRVPLPEPLPLEGVQ
jgi:SecD/SecF fusion protein